MVEVPTDIAGIEGSAQTARRKAYIAGFICAVLLGGGLGFALPRIAVAEPLTHYVVIEQMRFNPPTLTVQRGDRIQWVNKDLVAHTASANFLIGV